jgi:alanyl-tRNA synthetase
LFQPLIKEIARISGKQYGVKASWDIAIRVIADHLRAVAFSIADGQLPSNNRAGYVIRRILRRAVRYGYNHLEMEEPFIYKLLPVLVKLMGDQYPELKASEEQIAKIIKEEEVSFLKTLGKGLKMIGSIINDLNKDNKKTLPGKVAFELYDTYGFPLDLTQLILKEHDMETDINGFEDEMKRQKSRSREDASQDTGDWTVIKDTGNTVFTGYEKTEDEVLIARYRTVKSKGKEICQLVFDKTPFYAESGGQIGDRGSIISEKERIEIIDTIKENNLIVHISNKLPANPELSFKAVVDVEKRKMTANNHTATHLLHYALRSVLGKHVEQKGSLVTPDRLRFDFSHFGKPTKDELFKVEMIANRLVRENHHSKVIDGISMKEAQEMGAIALFGEKYGEKVRVVQFGDSVELCGGTHVDSTANIGIIKIVSEGAIAAGVRRIEAVTAEKAEEYINEKLSVAEDIAALFNNPKDLKASIEKLISENSNLRKTIEKLEIRDAMNALKELEEKAVMINDIRFISGRIATDNPDLLKTIAFEIRKKSEDSILVLGSESAGKAILVVMISDKLVKEKNLDAVHLIKEISGEINGGGGGQPFLATAGGKNPAGIGNALKKAEEYVREI